MYHKATTFPCPSNIVHTATTHWRHTKPKRQIFYGHSYTAPTPREWLLQKLGLEISNALAIHLRDAELGSLVKPTHEHDEDFAENTGLPNPPDDLDTDDFDFVAASALWSTQRPSAAPVVHEPRAPCAGLTASFFNSPTVVD